MSGSGCIKLANPAWPQSFRLCPHPFAVERASACLFANQRLSLDVVCLVDSKLPHHKELRGCRSRVSRVGWGAATSPRALLPLGTVQEEVGVHPYLPKLEKHKRKHKQGTYFLKGHLQVFTLSGVERNPGPS